MLHLGLRKARFTIATKSALPTETLLLPGPDKTADGLTPVLPEYTWDEIMKHDKARDLWLVVGGNVYNVGEFMWHHPGGPEILKEHHGLDATPKFLSVGHPPYALALTKSFLIGRVRADSVAPANRALARASTKMSLVSEEVKEIPIAVEELKLQGERWVNFDLLNDITSQLAYYHRFGHIYQVPLPGHGADQDPKHRPRLVVVSDPELLDEVADDMDQFGKMVEGVNFFKQLQLARGGGISVVSDSDLYQQIRRVMLPWYSPKHQRTQLEIMKSVAQQLCDVLDAMPDDKPLEMRDWLTRYALEVSGRGACQYSFGTLTPAGASPASVPTTVGEACPFGAAVTECLREAIARVAEVAPDRHVPFRQSEKRTKSRKFHKQSQLLFDMGAQIVDVRAHSRPVGEQVDLLSRLINEADPVTGQHLDMETVRDQILMHMSNGFNGPSVTLSWLVAELAKRPDVEARVIAEVDEISKGDPDYNLEYVDLLTMPYITQCIKESMRMYPPLPVTVRTSLKDGRLGAYRIQKGDIILVGSLAAQRDRRYWGEAPDVFDPDHFTPDKIALRHRLAFIPFSVGQRQCMAQEVTFMMLRIAVFYLYQRYRLRLAPGATVQRRGIVSNTPVSVKVVRERREDKMKRVANLLLAAETKRKAQQEAAIAAAAIASTTPTPSTADNARVWDVPSAIPVISAYRHIVIGFGSNFGSCRRLAEMMAERSHRYGFTCDVMPLDRLTELPATTIMRPWLLIVFTATYTGNPPSNATAFRVWLDKARRGLPAWTNCRYLVWGLGNTQWNAFLRFPTFVHQRLAQLGATPLAEMGHADVGQRTWEHLFDAWQLKVWPLLINLAGAKPSEAAALALAMEEAKRKESENNEQVALSGAAAAPANDAAHTNFILSPLILANGIGTETRLACVRVARQLCVEGAVTQTRHIEIELPEDVTYHAGDHLGVCPQNDPFVVAQVAKRLGVPLDGVFRLPAAVHFNALSAIPRDAVLQVRNLLTNIVDLCGPIPVELIKALDEAAKDDIDKKRLAELKAILTSDDGESAEPPSRMAALVTQRAGVLGVLEAFPDVPLNFAPFLQSLRALQPRNYSISSSPSKHGTKGAHITVGLLTEALDEGRQFRGMASSYMHSIRVGDMVNVFIDLAEGFRLHNDFITRPTIMVSAGTGFAPMRAFLHELDHARQQKQLADVALFHGIRHLSEDYIYKDEIEAFAKEGGVLTHLFIARSRDDSSKREYVQHKIVEQAALVGRLLQNGACVYVCGSEKMRADVRAAFVQVIEQTSQFVSHKDALTYVANLETQHRYVPDVWG